MAIIDQSKASCHNHDCTYPCLPYPDLSMPIPSHQNHPQAPNATPEPSDSIPSQLTSQQCTPEHSDSLVSSRCIPDPTLLQPFPFLASSQFPTSTLISDPMPFDLLCSCVKSISDVSSVLQLWSGKAQSCTSLAQCILVCPFSPSIYLYIPYVSSSVTLLLFLCLILSSPSPSTLAYSIFILSLH